MSVVKFVSLVGFASIVNGCNDPNSGIRTGACDPFCSGQRQDLAGHVDFDGCPIFCCTRVNLPKPICPPCTSDCDENFIGDCITYEDYIGMYLV